MPGTFLEANARDLQLLDEELMRNVRLRDPERLVDAFYAPEAKVLAHGLATISGRPAIREYWNSMFHAGLVDVRLETGQFETEHDLAYGMGRYTHTIETHPGLLNIEKGTHLAVYRRQPDGCWRALVESFSADA